MPIDKLPPRYRPYAERVAGHLSTDAGIMLILGTVLVYRGVAYWHLEEFVLVNPLDVWLPLWLVSGYWISLGLSLIVASWWQSSFMGRCLLTVSVMTLTSWGCAFLLAAPGTFDQRGSMYLAMAALTIWSVWRGRRGEIRVRKENPDVPVLG